MVLHFNSVFSILHSANVEILMKFTRRILGSAVGSRGRLAWHDAPHSGYMQMAYKPNRLIGFFSFAAYKLSNLINIESNETQNFIMKKPVHSVASHKRTIYL